MVLQDASIRAPSDLDVEIAQRAMNAGVTPTGIFPCHPYDELFNVDLSAGPSGTPPLQERPLLCYKLSIPA
jgi:hypothetical protein